MKIINYDTLKEKLYFEEMDNGLKVYLLPKIGFSKTYGLFSTKFGSIDTTFVPLGKDKMIKVPDGIAHFLEHKMFEMADGDASDKFAMLGANTNAFTSSSRTAYLFSTTSNESQCIELLLDFVQDLYLTDETVEKEKGIINQEISMYDDDPDWRVYFGAIENLYNTHPVKIDIAGSIDSVNSIDKETLELCYHTFYHPDNMMLFVVGNIDPKSTMELIRNNQAKKSFTPIQTIEREKVIEQLDIDKKEEVLNMDVSMPKLMMSIKVNDILTDAKDKLKRELGMTILLDLLFSKSSALYESWSHKGLINDSFAGSFTQERDYSFILIGGDTFEIDELKNHINDLIKNIHDYTFSEEEFNRVKRKNIGILISIFNSPESIANMFSRYYFEDIMVFDFIDYVNNLKIEDIYQLYDLFNIDYTSTFIVNPL